jgi:hypothetical protein
MARFVSKLSLLNPTKFVNDENVNKVLKELQGNIEYILNFLNGNKALLQGVFGNLWDYDRNGRRVLINGGVADTYKKANTWQALNDLIIANDDEVIWDRDNSRTIYKGRESITTNRSKWLEREVWIPETLRDQSLIFSIKASGSTAETGWTEDNAVCETIGVQILGGEEDVQVFKEVGVWKNHEYFSNDSYGTTMKTVTIPFKTSPSTNSVKIRIFRTVNTGFLHIDRVFLGGVALPYDNETEVYDFDGTQFTDVNGSSFTGIDINEFFDFYNNKTKVIANNVLGHKVAESRDKIKGNDLVTWHHFNQMLREVFTYGSVYTSDTVGTTGTSGTSGTPGTSGTSGTPGTSGSPSDKNWRIINVHPLFGSVQGKIDCNQTDRHYLVEHPILEKPSTPLVSLTIPSSDSQIFVQGIYDVQPDHFYVVLSDIPSEDGYEINWTLGNSFSPLDALNALDLPSEESEICDDPEVYPDLFNYEQNL